jgi:hypothetical protein
MEARLHDYLDLKLKLDGIVPPGHGFHRNLLFDALYSSLPRDPQVKVQIYNAEIVPGGYTNWHCHNGAAFFVALQGIFEAHFQEGAAGESEGRRVLFRSDCQISPRAQPSSGSAVLHRCLLYLSRPRARDQFHRTALVNSLPCHADPRSAPAFLFSAASRDSNSCSRTPGGLIGATRTTARGRFPKAMSNRWICCLAPDGNSMRKPVSSLKAHSSPSRPCVKRAGKPCMHSRSRRISISLTSPATRSRWNGLRARASCKIFRRSTVLPILPFLQRAEKFCRDSAPLSRSWSSA